MVRQLSGKPKPNPIYPFNIPIWMFPAKSWSKNMFEVGFVSGLCFGVWCEVCFGYVSGYVSGHGSEYGALDERVIVGVCMGICIRVCMVVCIEGAKHAPLHEFLTPTNGKTHITPIALFKRYP